MTAGLAKSCSYKAKLYKKCKLKPTDKNKENNKKYRNFLNNLLYITKKIYYSEKLDSRYNDSRQIWKTIGSLINRGKCKETPTVFKEIDIEIKDNLLISEKFNDYFVNIGPNLA